MLAFTVVISLNKPEYCGTSLFNGDEGLLINPLHFERVKEAFAGDIIKAVTFATHVGA